MKNNSGGGLSCGCGIALLIFNLVLGGWSVNLLLDVFAHKMIPFFWAMVIGLIGGEVTIPTAIVVSILRWFKVI